VVRVYVKGNMGRAGCPQKKCPHEAKPRAAFFGNAPTPRVLPGKPLADFFCFHFSTDTHWASWNKKNNQRLCIMDDETRAQWEEQAFHFCQALLDYFSVKGRTPIFGNKIPSQREGSSLHQEGIICTRKASVQALPHLRCVPEAGRPREPVENHGRACTDVLFLSKAELGIVHLLEIVTGWLVPSTIKDPAC